MTRLLCADRKTVTVTQIMTNCNQGMHKSILKQMNYNSRRPHSLSAANLKTILRNYLILLIVITNNYKVYMHKSNALLSLSRSKNTAWGLKKLGEILLKIRTSF